VIVPPRLPPRICLGRSAGDSEDPITAEVFSSSGTPVASYQSPDMSEGAIDPGASLSPSGGALLAGSSGLAPSTTNGNAVYESATGEELLGLPNAALAADQVYDWPAPSDAWAPNGIDVLAGGNAVYACDACGSLAQMQEAAQTRLAWEAPLSAAHDVPPGESPYG
jgi:hypothetical protein